MSALITAVLIVGGVVAVGATLVAIVAALQAWHDKYEWVEWRIGVTITFVGGASLVIWGTSKGSVIICVVGLVVVGWGFVTIWLGSPPRSRR